ncbi:MAG: hypothetical protein ACLSB9_05070 [Hydrogeniiclostridium mannosilyticum]
MMPSIRKNFEIRWDSAVPGAIAYTVNYDLSDMEAKLYAAVTDYVQEEFNRADNLNNDRRTTVGFA